MAVQGIAFSARNAAVRLGGNIVYNQHWSVDPQGNPLDTSNMESGGYETQIIGLRKLEGEITGWLDAGNPFDAPLSLSAGAKLTNLILYLNGVGSPNWAFPNGVTVLSMSTEADVKDLLKYRLRFKGYGQWSYPTGVVPATT